MKPTTPRPEFRSSRTSAAILLALFTFVSPLSPLFASAAQAQGSRLRPVSDSRAGQAPDKGAQQGGEGATKSPDPAAPAVVSAGDIKITMDDGVAAGQFKRPGETITYTVTIKNTHATDPATNVKFLDDLTANLNLTFVNGSVQTQPIARADTFDVLGNVRIQVADGAAASGNSSGDLLNNDFDPDTAGNSGLTITAFGPTVGNEQTAGNASTSARGGDVTVNANGSFSYNPPAGYDGTDSFKYTVTDATGKTDTATATFTVANMIWFVQTGATSCTSRAAGCGRLTNPFSDLQSFATANGGAGTNNGDTVDPEAGDNIFLYTGNANYIAPLTLVNTQKLVGQGATASLAAITGVTPPAFSDALPNTKAQDNTLNPPTITSAAGGILLASGNTLRGFNVGAVGTAAAQSKIQGTNFGTLTIGNSASPDVSLSGAGRMLSLTTGALSATSGFNSAASTSSADAAIFLSGLTGGSLSFAGVTIAGGTGEGIEIVSNAATISFGGLTSVSDGTSGIVINTTSVPVTFGNTSVTSSSAPAVLLSNNTAAVSFGDLDIAPDSAGTGLQLNNCTGTTTATSGTISTTNAPAINVTTAALNLTFDSVSADNDAPVASRGIQLSGASGTVAIAGGTITGGTAPAVQVSAGSVALTYAGGITQAQNASLLFAQSGHTGSITFQTGTLSATNGNGLQFDNADGTYNFNGTTSLNGGDAGIDIINSSNGTFNFGASTTVTNANAGPAFNVGSSPENPTVNFNGTLSQSNAQRVVSIDGTTGNTITFANVVTATNTSTGVLIQNANGGNVTFTGGLSLGTAGTRLTSNAVSILKGTGNGNGTFALGAVSIFTNNATGIVATDIDGTVNATGNVNSTNGPAINVDGPAGLTTLGMTYTSVNANGSTHGIRVRDTNGNFTVNGTGTTDGSGGTIQNTDTRGAEFISATNVTLKNMNFTNANDTTDGGGAGNCDDLVLVNCNSAIYMNGVTTVATLDNLNVTGTMVENGITAIGVQNLKLDNSVLDGCGNEALESCFEGQNLSGTSTVNNTEIRFSETNSFDVHNNDQTWNLSINNSIFRDTQTSGLPACPGSPCNGANGILLRNFSPGAGTPTMTVNITNSQFLRLRTQAIQVVAEEDSIVNIDITGNTIDTGPNAPQIGSGIEMVSNDTAQLNFNVLNNPTILTRQGSPINIQAAGSGSKAEGRVNDNGSLASPITTRSNLGGATGVPIRFVAQEGSDVIAEARRNFVAEDATSTENHLVESIARIGDSRLDVTYDDNTIVLNNGTPLADFGLTSGSSAAGENTILCANLVSNNGQGTGASNALRIRVSDIGAGSDPRVFLEGFNTNSETTWNNKGNTPVSVGGSEVNVSLTAGAVAPSAPPGGACNVVDTSANFTINTKGGDDVVQPATQAAAQQQLVIPGLMITRPATQPAQKQLLGQTEAPTAQPGTAAAQQASAAQPKAASAKSAQSQDSKGGDEKSKKDGGKTGVVSPRAGQFEVNIGTLPAQDEVTITFQVTIAETLSPAAANSVSNQGTVTADGGISKSSDDPQTTPPAAGDGNDATVTNIDKFEPAIDVVSSDPTTDQGDSVTFTATLGLGTAPGVPAPTGTVDFVDTQGDADPLNDEVLCNDVAISGATAQCATTAVDAGTRTIAAIYSGDGRYDTATDTVTQTVTACNASPVVTSEADSGAGTLREAITGACDGASITFNIADADPDVITLTTAELLIDKSLAIIGPGANVLTVQRDTAVGTPAFRVFSVAAGKTVTIGGLTVANGLQDGIAFPQNAGGGIFNEGELSLVGLEVTGNTAVGGAGGGIFNAPGGLMSISITTLSGNSGFGGGGVYNGGTLSIANSTVSGNSSPADGGGIQTNSAQPVTLTNITVTNNRADSDDNASGTGGGIYIQSGTPVLRNSIVADNYRGAGTATEDDAANGSFDPASFNNLIGTGGAGGLSAGTNGNLVGVTSPGLGALASNGGATRTHKLLAGSAALDAGNNCVTTIGGCGAGDPVAAVASDQRGFTRPADGSDANTTDTVDIGAVEMQASVQTFADASIAQDTSHTVTDFSVGDSDRTLTVTGTSDNTTLVPNANIVITAGSSADKRTLTVTPAAGQTGVANITVTVTDTASGDSMSDTFQLTVAALAVPTVTITADTPDPSNSGQAVTVTFTVTGSMGTPTGNVVITASGGAETCMASVATGTCDITLVAAGNRTLTATYSGDGTYAGGTDTEPHAVFPNVAVSDATATEASQLATFTVHLDVPSTETVTVNFTTADGGANPATAGSDYTTTSGNVVFDPGQTLKTIAVPVSNSDAAGEADETFLVNLTGATNGNVSVPPADNQAVGTITEANNAGAILISEIRTSGPGGAGDQFVEVYNNSDSPVTVAATDASAGWALVAANNGCAGDPVVVGIIPNGEVIPARGHYLFAGSAYSLSSAATLNLTLAADLAADANVALFSTSNSASFSSQTRLDAVGFFDGVTGLGGNCDLLREGTPLIAAQGSTSQYSFFRRLSSGKPQDTGRSVDDFSIVSTTPSVAVGFNSTPALGAPGPENIASPIQRNDKIKASLIDPMQSSGDAPNSVRKFCATPAEECDANRSQFGTFSIRRRWTNTTGDNITSLRFRLVNVTVGPAPAGTADLRGISSLGVSGVPVTGGGTVDIEGTTLDAPTQPLGGGFNSTLSAGTITMATPLAPGASINLQFLLGVQQPGAYTFFVNVEAGPAPAGALMTNRQSAPAKEGVNKSTLGGRN